MQEISANTGQRWVFNRFINAAINETNFTKRKTGYRELITKALKCLILIATLVFVGVDISINGPNKK